MGRSYVFGLLVGTVVSAAALAGVSLMAPVGGVQVRGGSEVSARSGADSSPAAAPDIPASEAPSAVATGTEDAPAAQPEAAQAEVAQPETAQTGTAESAPLANATPTGEAVLPEPRAETATASPGEAVEPADAKRPQALLLEVPPGSEFARPGPEVDPVVPAAEPEPTPSPMPIVTAPTGEAAPGLAEVAPAQVPETAAAPAAPASPEPPLPASDTALPAPEGSVPVPPPGEAEAPRLLPGAVETAPAAPAPMTLAEAAGAPVAPESAPTGEVPPAATAEPVPEPAPVPSADAEPPPETDAAPEVVAPPAFVDDAPGPPEEYLPEETIPEDIAPEDSLPGSDGGPVIIGVAPHNSFGAANAPQPGFRQKIQPGFGQKIQPGFGQAGNGVRVIRPGASDATPESAPLTDPAPGASPSPGQPSASVADDALRRHAAPFANPDMKPLVAIILADLGDSAGGVTPDALTQLGGPVTIAIDPEAPDAAARAAVYRLAGHEVAILAPNLPKGATPSDLEVSYQASVSVLPEAVAVVGRPGSAFQADRRIAQHLVALLAGEGRGIVTYTRGLDPARQAAEGMGLPHAAIFRDLDAEGENPATIQRYLDRAAFEAARTGAVVVMGTTSPGTVAALQAWIAGGAKDVAVGPASAVMLGN